MIDRRWFVSLALTLAVLLPCSGVARAQDASMSLTVELGDVSPTKVPFIIAAESGIYARNGLTVTQFINPQAAANVRQSGVIVPPEYVQNAVGDINIGGGSPTIVRMTTVAAAPQRVILATSVDRSAFHLFARNGITSLAGLRGKRIGYSGEGALDQLTFLVAIRRLGWNADRDVAMLSGISGPDAAAAYHIDAFIADEYVGTEAAKQGYHDVLDFGTYHIPMLGSGVNARKDWLATHRAAAAAFVKSTVEAIALMKTDKAAAIAAMTKWYGISDPALLQPIYDQAVQVPDKPYPSLAGLKVVRSIYGWREMQIHPVGYFIDPSFVAALDKSGYIDGLYRK